MPDGDAGIPPGIPGIPPGPPGIPVRAPGFPLGLPWWPQLIFDLCYLPRPEGLGLVPVSYPRAVEDMMASLGMHAMSYFWLDQEAAAKIRTAAEAQLVSTAKQLSVLHEASAEPKPS